MFRIACCVAKACLLLAVAFVLTALAIGQDETAKLYDLHVSTPTGTIVWFIESATSEQALTTGSKNPLTSFQFDRTFGITVKQVEANGNRVVEIHVARVAGWLQFGQANKKLFDSDDPDAEEYGKAIGNGTMTGRLMATAGRRYTARIDPNGKLVGSTAGISHEMQGETTQDGAQDWELVHLAETAFGRTPAKPTAIGGAWKFVQPGMGPMVARHTTLTLAGVTGNAYEMVISGSVERRKAPATAKDAGQDSSEAKSIERTNAVKIRNGKLTGKQTLSRQDGLVIETESKSTFDIHMHPDLPIRTMTMVAKTKLTRTTKPDIKPPKKRPARKTAREQAKTVKAQTDTKLIADAVRMFYAKNSQLPDTLERLAQKDERGRSELESLPNDSWGQAFKLVPGATPREFEVVSAGPDKKHGTADDISSRTKRP